MHPYKSWNFQKTLLPSGKILQTPMGNCWQKVLSEIHLETKSRWGRGETTAETKLQLLNWVKGYKKLTLPQKYKWYYMYRSFENLNWTGDWQNVRLQGLTYFHNFLLKTQGHTRSCRSRLHQCRFLRSNTVLEHIHQCLCCNLCRRILGRICIGSRWLCRRIFLHFCTGLTHIRQCLLGILFQ